MSPERPGSFTSSPLSLFTWPQLLLGAAALSFYAVHAVTWLRRGVPGALLWACHLGCLLVGIAVLARRPALNGVGVLWLVLGNLLWAVDLAAGGEFIFTSPLTHVGGLSIGVCHARRAGFPRRSWLAALAGIAALHLLSGWVTPPAENINVAFRVHPSLQGIVPGFLAFRILMLAASAALFYAAELLIRRIVKSEK
ncbi:MAG TPA: hypothetical protein PK919_01540 [Candidatus Aminicenantes bacterium]|nr:hypothetical protein [Candidatus Aminicenantes bacterium]